MSEWRELKTLQEVAAAQANGDEIEVRLAGAWVCWPRNKWRDDDEYRARPKAETVTLRKALFSNDLGFKWSFDCNEGYAKAEESFVCWIGDPVTYTKGGE